MLSWGGQALSQTLPRALRAENGIEYEGGSFLREALLGGGLGEGLPSPRKSISLKKSPSDLEILLSYDRAHTVYIHCTGKSMWAQS